ncbi:MAG: hypothetical protein QOD77_724 [Thermoplasmata archaeon]|jgi:glycosyltransferase involved in cell wall biosynthesis|nr:hypothetical protein [Thermoplasmata archaeon]
MRILAVTPYYSPEGGGLERYAHQILRRLAGRGHDVQALAFSQTRAGRVDVEGVPVEFTMPDFRIGNAPVGAGFLGAVRDRIARDRPDVVLAHTPVPFSAEMASLAAARAGVPFVATYHAGRLQGSTGVRNVLAALDRATLERRMLKNAARLIAVTPYVRDHALGKHKDRVAIIPPGVDHATFAPQPMEDAPPKEVLFVGPLDRSYGWKGADVLWDAFQAVAKAHPAARLRLVGKGDRAAEFRRLGARLGGVEVSGRLSDPELVAAYNRACVTVLPSLTDAESFGMVLAEANACERPVVASRVGGIPDFVAHGENGLLAAPGDARDLAAQLCAVLADEGMARRMGRAGRKRVIEGHDWDELAKRTEAVLADAANA